MATFDQRRQQVNNQYNAAHDITIVQVMGDGNTVVPNYAHLELTRYLGRRGRIRSEADLLSPYGMTIPMIGRGPLLEELRRWMTNSPPISIRVIVGRAGSGKTRLALELCETMLADHWDTGFVTDRELVRFMQQQNLSTWGWQHPTLIVVDEAATRARLLHNWLVELADNAGDPRRPLRLLLLERHADPGGFRHPPRGWWEQVFGRGGGEADMVRGLLDPPNGPIILAGFTEPEERRQILAAISESARGTVSPPEGGIDPALDQQLAALSWGDEPLFLMMAGLLAMRLNVGRVLALARTELAFHIAENEIDRIQKIADDRRVNTDFLSYMAAYNTLCQGLDRTMLEDAIDEEKAMLKRPTAGDAHEIARALTIALPGEGGAAAPLLPDVIGGAVVLRSFGNLFGDLPPERQCAAVSRAARRAQANVVATVIRLAQDYAVEGAQEPLEWLDHLVQEYAGSLDALMEIAVQFDMGTAVQLVGHWLPDSTRDVRERALGVYTTIAEAARQLHASEDREATRALLAVSLHNLGSYLGMLRHWEEALAATQEAVALYRSLTATDPKAFRPELARALDTLSSYLGPGGHSEEAVTAAQEAVALYRVLAATDSEAFRSELAHALDTLGDYLGSVGHWEEALASAQEAVALYRALTAAHPKAFSRLLAMSLHNLGVRFSDLGRREDELAATQEAVELHRALVGTHPDAVLTLSLHSLSGCLRNLGRREEALAAAQEAVIIDRALTAPDPEAFRDEVALQLTNLGCCLGDLGRWEEAVAAAQEAVALWRAFTAAHPECRPELAGALDTLGRCLSMMKRWEEALVATQEAVALWRALVPAGPIEGNRRHANRYANRVVYPGLAGSLNNFGFYLGALEHWEEAVAAAQEAVALYRSLTVAHPEAFRDELARAQANLSGYLEVMGH